MAKQYIKQNMTRSQKKRLVAAGEMEANLQGYKVDNASTRADIKSGFASGHEEDAIAIFNPSPPPIKSSSSWEVSNALVAHSKEEMECLAKEKEFSIDDEMAKQAVESEISEVTSKWLQKIDSSKKGNLTCIHCWKVTTGSNYSSN